MVADQREAPEGAAAAENDGNDGGEFRRLCHLVDQDACERKPGQEFAASTDRRGAHHFGLLDYLHLKLEVLELVMAFRLVVCLQVKATFARALSSTFALVRLDNICAHFLSPLLGSFLLQLRHLGLQSDVFQILATDLLRPPQPHHPYTCALEPCRDVVDGYVAVRDRQQRRSAETLRPKPQNLHRDVRFPCAWRALDDGASTLHGHCDRLLL
mmetsp:Transcript_81600/g.234485  ORF Transcript_81600/g.234485 Transcript_81600/m.234485 type:complete len:213 (-) Transcript_81600:70-708(-)